MDSRSIGNLLIVAGILLAIGGIMLRAGLLSFLGRLPGDFRYEGGHTEVYFPIGSMLLVSVVLTIIAAVARRFF